MGIFGYFTMWFLIITSIILIILLINYFKTKNMSKFKFEYNTINVENHTNLPLTARGHRHFVEIAHFPHKHNKNLVTCVVYMTGFKVKVKRNTPVRPLQALREHVIIIPRTSRIVIPAKNTETDKDTVVYKNILEFGEHISTKDYLKLKNELETKETIVEAQEKKIGDLEKWIDDNIDSPVEKSMKRLKKISEIFEGKHKDDLKRKEDIKKFPQEEEWQD